ncbi:hypothetical protein ACWGE1_01605 [Streptomyces sp. NPDC054932]
MTDVCLVTDQHITGGPVSASEFEFTITYTARFDPGELGTQFHEFIKVRESDPIDADDDLTSTQEETFTATSRVMQRRRTVRVRKDVADTEIGTEEIYADIALRSQQNLDPVVGPDCKGTTPQEPFNPSTPPLQVHFAILHCYETEDSTTDECILKWNGNTFWAGEMKGGRDRDTDTFVLLPAAGEGIVSLTEEDSPDPDDHLGSHVIRMDELGQGWHRAFFQNDDTANYHLDYEVFQA